MGAKKIKDRERKEKFKYRSPFGGKKRKFHPFEANTHLEAIVNFTLDDGRKVGGLLLNLGTEDKPEYKVRFGWKCKGFHDTNILDSNSANQIVTNIAALGAEIPMYEKLRVELQTFCDPRSREAELVEMYENIPDRAVNALRFATAERIDILKKLDRKGKRRPKEIFLFGDYTPNVEKFKNDWLESFVRRLLDIYHKLAGSYRDIALQRADSVLLKAIQSGFTAWDDLFRDKLQVGCNPLTGEELWQFCYLQLNRFNDRALDVKPPLAPQLIEFNLQTGEVWENVRTHIHPTSLMLQQPSAVPVAKRDCTVVDGKYVAAMLLESQPGGWDGANGKTRSQSQLEYLWNLLDKRAARDLRIVLEITRIDNLGVRAKNDRLIRQAQGAKREAEAKGRMEVAADLQIEEAVKAQRQTISGDPTLEFALTMFAYRNSESDARAAARELGSYFQSPALLSLEIDISDYLWLSSLPIYGRSMLYRYRNRRGKERPLYTAGYFPLLNTISRHQTGIEFIASRGAAPIYYDPFKFPGHTLILGQTRSGKSLLMSEIVAAGLSKGIPFTILDQPASKEANTFEVFTNKLGGSYIDIFNTQFNFLETFSIPTELSSEVRSDAIKQHQSYVYKILRGMVLGWEGKSGDVNATLASSLLVSAIAAFYNSQEIKLRIAKAKEGGLGSQAWADYPILKDFISYCSIERLKIRDADAETAATLKFIQRQLIGWCDGEYGATLNAPSQVPLDRDLITIALRQVSDKDRAVVFGTLAQMIAMRRAILASRNPQGSAFFVDEASNACKLDPISATLAETMVICLKQGMRMFLAGQEGKSIFNSIGGDQIRNAIFYWLVGRIDAGDEAKADFIDLGVPADIVAINASSEFAPDRSTNSSQWALRIDDIWTHGRIYLPQSIVDMTANNLDERLARMEREQQLASAA